MSLRIGWWQWSLALLLLAMVIYSLPPLHQKAEAKWEHDEQGHRILPAHTVAKVTDEVLSKWLASIDAKRTHFFCTEGRLEGLTFLVTTTWEDVLTEDDKKNGRLLCADASGGVVVLPKPILSRVITDPEAVGRLGMKVDKIFSERLDFVLLGYADRDMHIIYLHVRPSYTRES